MTQPVLRDSRELMTSRLAGECARVAMLAGFVIGLWLPHNSAWWLSILAGGGMLFFALRVVLNLEKYGAFLPPTEPLALSNSRGDVE